MRIPSLLLAGTALVVVLAIGIAWKYARLTGQVESTLRSMAENQTRIEALLQHSAAQGQNVAPVAARSAPRLARLASGTIDEVLKRFQQSQKDPNVQLRELAAARSRAARSYGALFEKLKLSPAQIEKFQDNLANRYEQNMDLTAIGRQASEADPQSAAETAAAVAQFRKKMNADYQSAQQELLGDASYAQLQEYERTLPVQTTASALAGTAVLMGVPFTTQQAEQLKQILQNASGDYRNGGAATSTSVDWDVVDAQAQSILSGPQMAVLRDIGAPTDGRAWNEFARARLNAQQSEIAGSAGAAASRSGR